MGAVVQRFLPEKALKGTKIYISNMAAVAATLTLIREYQLRARAAQLEALSSAEVFERLSTWSAELVSPLASLQLKPPVVADDFPRHAAA